MAFYSDDDDSQRGPDPVSSGRRSSPPGPALPTFPNNVDLVLDESNTHLLKALLPALNKYNCLDFTTTKQRRSPWVRAFCDLYHPSGPWGSRKFSKAPDIASKTKYGFKSYKVPKIYATLKNYPSKNRVHMDLLNALKEYMSREEYYKSFLVAATTIARVEANKPMATRANLETLTLTSGDVTLTIEAATLAIERRHERETTTASTRDQTTESNNSLDLVDKENSTPPATPTVASSARTTRKRDIRDFMVSPGGPTPVRRRLNSSDSDVATATNKEGWRCELCTFLNGNEDHLACGVCSASRRTKDAAAAATAAITRTQPNVEEETESEAGMPQSQPGVMDGAAVTTGEHGAGDGCDNDNDDGDNDERVQRQSVPLETLSQPKAENFDDSVMKSPVRIKHEDVDDSKLATPAKDNITASQDASAEQTPQKETSLQELAKIDANMQSTSVKLTGIKAIRAKLTNLLQLRKEGGDVTGDDPVCRKINAQIDRLDEEMVDIIVN